MIKLEHVVLSSPEQMEFIIEGMRNPMNSWEKSDSEFETVGYDIDDFEIKGCPSKKDIWWQMIQLLPSSYNQTRNILMNYEVLANMYHSRKNHKLDEWREFCKWIEELPYSKLITGEEKLND